MRIAKFILPIAFSAVIASCNSSKSVSNTAKKDFSRTEVDANNAFGSAQNGAVSYIGVNDIAKQLNGEWNIMTVNNKKINAENRAYINLDFSKHRLYGNNGCNYINGGFEAEANKISFTNLITTLMACPNSSSERAVMKAMGDVVSFKLLEKNKITYLHLLNAKGHTLMTLRRQNVDFVDGAWTVKEIDGVATADKEVRLVIDTEQLKIHGCTGCNIVNGDIYIDTTKDRAIQFQQLISTRKMCANMKTETALLVALEETYYCEKSTADEIKFLDEHGKVVVVLTRLALEKGE